MIKTFLGIEQTPYDKARVVVIPYGYERTVSYLKGTAQGPKAIIEASSQVELYDIEFDSEPHLVGIHTLVEPEQKAIPPEDALKQVYEMVGQVIGDGKLPVLLGGEHSISQAGIRACFEKFPDLSVLQIDAHADLRESYEDSKYSHASAMRRVSEMVPYVGVGIRSVGPEESREFKLRRASGGIFTRDDFITLKYSKPIVDKLSHNVYITIDADGFDPSVIPGVGTPEPGGLSYDDVDRLLRDAVASRNVVGFDFVELRPIAGEVRSEFTAAKVIYKTIARIFRNRE